MEIYSILLTESCLCNNLPNKIKALPTQTFSNLVVIQMTAIKSLSQLKLSVFVYWQQLFTHTNLKNRCLNYNIQIKINTRQ